MPSLLFAALAFFRTEEEGIVIDEHLLNAKGLRALFGSRELLWATDCDIAIEQLFRLQTALKSLQEGPIALSQTDVAIAYLVAQSEKIIEQIQELKALESTVAINKKRKQIAQSLQQLLVDVHEMLAKRSAKTETTKVLYLFRANPEDEDAEW